MVAYATPFADWIPVTRFGADPGGAEDSTAAFSYAISRLGGQPGGIYIPAGTYKLRAGMLGTVQGQSIVGAGSSAAVLQFTGTGAGFAAARTGAFTGGEYAGHYEGFQMTGYSTGAGSCGIQAGNMQGFSVRDVAIYGFPGQGMHFLNTGGDWAEQGTIRARIVQCGTYGDDTTGAVVFDASSFDYTDFDFTIVTSPGVNGVVLRNDAFLRGARLRMRGNFYARAAANTGAVIAVAPAGGADGSYITDASFDVAVESAGTGGQVGHASLLMGSSSAASQLTGAGVLSFNPFGPATIYFKGISNASTCPLGFSGYLQDGTPAGAPGGAGDGLVVHGGSNWYPNGTLAGLAGGTGLDYYWQFGDVIEGKLNSGDNTLVFHATAGKSIVRRCRLFLSQPSSGAAGTVTWPNVKWPGGAAPALSSVNGYVDQVDLIYLPDTAAWYGTLLGVHYS